MTETRSAKQTAHEEWRKLLWEACPHPPLYHRYGDDGELQCQALPEEKSRWRIADFKRDAPENIIQHVLDARCAAPTMPTREEIAVRLRQVWDSKIDEAGSVKRVWLAVADAVLAMMEKKGMR